MGAHLTVLGEEAKVEGEVEVGHRLVEETGVASLVAGHEGEDLGSDGGSLLQAAAELLVEEETGELGGAGALEELDEDAALLTGDAVGGLLEGVVADEVLLVEVILELAEDRDELRLVEVGVDLLAEELLHLVEVGGVEAGGEEVLGGSLLDAVASELDAGLRVDLGGGANLDGRALRRLARSGGGEAGGGFAGAHGELRGDAGRHGGGGHGGGHGVWLEEFD